MSLKQLEKDFANPSFDQETKTFSNDLVNIALGAFHNQPQAAIDAPVHETQNVLGTETPSNVSGTDRRIAEPFNLRLALASGGFIGCFIGCFIGWFIGRFC